MWVLRATCDIAASAADSNDRGNGLFAETSCSNPRHTWLSCCAASTRCATPVLPAEPRTLASPFQVDPACGSSTRLIMPRPSSTLIYRRASGAVKVRRSDATTSAENRSGSVAGSSTNRSVESQSKARAVAGEVCGSEVEGPIHSWTPWTSVGPMIGSSISRVDWPGMSSRVVSYRIFVVRTSSISPRTHRWTASESRPPTRSLSARSRDVRAFACPSLPTNLGSPSSTSTTNQPLSVMSPPAAQRGCHPSCSRTGDNECLCNPNRSFVHRHAVTFVPRPAFLPMPSPTIR